METLIFLFSLIGPLELLNQKLFHLCKFRYRNNNLAVSSHQPDAETKCKLFQYYTLGFESHDLFPFSGNYSVKSQHFNNEPKVQFK